MTQPADGQVYRASDGQWYRWPDPTPYPTEDAAKGTAPAPLPDPVAAVGWQQPTPAAPSGWPPTSGPTTPLPSNPVAVERTGAPWWRSTPAVAAATFLLGLGIGSATGKSDPEPASTLVQDQPTEAPVVAATTAAAPVASKAPPAATKPAAASPTAARAGKPRHKSFQVEALTITKDFVDDFEGNARITNIGDTSRTATFTFTVFVSGRQVATLDGSVSDAEPGRTLTVDLISSDDYRPGPYTWEFQVNAEF